ncbi:MAG: hypothetical protein ACYC65_06550, partial [Candidatus Limnocylindrales bacterium]
AGLPDDALALPGGEAGWNPREQLLRRIATSRRSIERAARSITGRETEIRPLEHPLVGRMGCGEWLPFSGVHDLTHLEHLEALEASLR